MNYTELQIMLSSLGAEIASFELKPANLDTDNTVCVLGTLTLSDGLTIGAIAHETAVYRIIFLKYVKYLLGNV